MLLSGSLKYSQLDSMLITLQRILKPTCWVPEFLSGNSVMQYTICQVKDARIAMSEISRQFLEHLKASVLRNIIIVVLNMSIDVFLELRDLQIVVALIVRVHLDPVVPVELPDAHCDMGLSVSEWTIDLWLGSIEIEVLKPSWERGLEWWRRGGCRRCWYLD
jgi:hypothetical protein